MRSPDDMVIEETRQRLEPDLRWLAGDMSPAEYDLWRALDDLEDVRGQIDDWAYDVIVTLAKKGAKEWHRGRGNRTTFKNRNRILKAEARRLMERGYSLTGACRIISKALPHMPGAMTADAIKKAVGSKSGN